MTRITRTTRLLSPAAVAAGKRLRAMRLAAGLTQRALGEHMNCTDANVSCWERGTHEPDIKGWMMLAARLRTTPEYLSYGVQPT